MPAVRIEVLGPLRVEVGERPADLGGPRQRALLARLVLAGGDVVSTDRLIDDLWAGDPPPKALGALQAHISYLRRAIEPGRPPRAPATVLISEAPGYALRLDRSAVDAWQFERLLADGDPDPAQRYRVLGDALACWHGEPYAPFATTHWVIPEAARLHELRRLAVERRAEAALALGHPDEAFALLHSHVADHPDRENAARLLALTQYRLGRQLDALATLRRVRTYLDTEFGVLPGPALGALETAILTHAPELDQPPVPADPARSPGSTRPAAPTTSIAGSPKSDPAFPNQHRADAADRIADAGRLIGDGANSARIGATQPADRVAGASRPAHVPLSVDSAAADRPGDGGRADLAGTRSRFIGAAVGYDAERSALLAEAGEVVAHGRARVVWLEGEAGAGKTTQAESLACALAADGWTVVSAACPEVDGAPAAWAWIHLLDGLGVQTVAGAVSPRGERAQQPTAPGSPRVLGAQIAAAPVSGHGETARTSAGPASESFGARVSADPGPDGFGAQAGPFAIAQSVTRACGQRLADGPVLVVLEDVHRADSATLQILRQVVAWLAQRPVLVLVTARGYEADAGVRATAAALAATTGRRLELGGLDTAAVRAVAARAGLGSIDDDTAERLRERTGGNPLFVREVAKLAAAVGDLHAVPDGVRDVLSRRIARLPAGAARALRLAAVWGDDIDFDTLLELTAEPEETLIDLVDTVTVAGLVRITGTDRISFAHALIRDAVYGDIPALRRARLHWSALELLERRTGTTIAGLESATGAVDLDAMAHHAIAGAGTANAGRALRYVLAAARRRTARRAHQDAEPLWRSALELHTRAGHGSATASRDDRLAALSTRCALINALAYGGNDEQARILRVEALETARASMPTSNRHAVLDIATGPATEPGRGAAIGPTAATGHRAATGSGAAAGGGVVVTGGGVAPDGATHDGSATTPVTDPPTITTDPIVVVLTCWRAPTIWTSRERGAPDRGMRADLAAALTRTTAPDLRIRLLVTAAFEVVGFDNPHAFACSAEALRAARELGDPELLCAALNARAFVALGPDLWPERGDLADELLRVSTEAGLPEYQAVAHFLRFLVASGAGRLVAARAEIAKALDCAEGGQLGPLLVVSTAHLAVLAALRGDFATAKAVDADLSAKMIAAGHANGAELTLLAEMMTGWALGDLAPGLDGYAALNAAAPHALRSAYMLALLDAGHTEQAAALLGAGTPVLRDYYWCAMSVFEARVVARIGTVEAARRLYQDLLPRAGTIAGMDSGSVAFGPVDTVLAELADRLGDHAAATAHRAAAEDVLAAIAAELAALDDIGIATTTTSRQASAAGPSATA
ncbi:BTAD domain-containing putative transcriptional regulator [Nocardia sp. NPDC060259]|uniref:BTAD domain-containing putative transcriptional regulator n=1 Tax=Nocardia sp. NPDC060259 TaxID=3347088 RepID=UPI0036628264